MLTIRHAVLAVGIVSLTGPAQADVKVVQELTITNPQIAAMIQSMTPAQRVMISRSGMGGFMTGAPVTTVTYTHGRQARVDIGPETIIVNVATHKMTTLNRTTHTYAVGRYAPQVNTQVQAQVRDTGQTKMIAGHRARHYNIVVKSAALQGGQLSGDIWSAPDLPQPAVSLLASGPASGLEADVRRIKGMPLTVNLTMTGSPMGATNIHCGTTAISVQPLPPSVFAIPAGYKKGAAAPMGGGMTGGLP